MSFSPEDLETRARNLIISTYQRAGLPLPEGWDDLDVLGSLGVGIAINEHVLRTQPKVKEVVINAPSRRKPRSATQK
jgi:hypothetical protein